MKALSKKPRDRYFSANAMLDDIEIESPPGTAESPRSARHKARGGALVLASVLILLLLLGGGGALASGLVGLPQDGSVADTLSRMNPVETEPPAPPQGAQGDRRRYSGRALGQPERRLCDGGGFLPGEDAGQAEDGPRPERNGLLLLLREGCPPQQRLRCEVRLRLPGRFRTARRDVGHGPGRGDAGPAGLHGNRLRNAQGPPVAQAAPLKRVPEGLAFRDARDSSQRSAFSFCFG